MKLTLENKIVKTACRFIDGTYYSNLWQCASLLCLDKKLSKRYRIDRYRTSFPSHERCLFSNFFVNKLTELSLIICYFLWSKKYSKNDILNSNDFLLIISKLLLELDFDIFMLFLFECLMEIFKLTYCIEIEWCKYLEKS